MATTKGVKNHLAGITAQIAGVALPERGALTKTRGSGAVGAPVQLAQYSLAYQELERKIAELSATQGKPMRVRLDLCDDGEHHASPINLENVKALKANLGANGQTTPATLRRKSDGRFEIITGRHRKRALQELGEEEWDAVVKDVEDDFIAVKDSFFDNLLARKLTDLETYLGYRRLKEEGGYTFERLAEESDRAVSTIHHYFIFARVPDALMPVVAQHQATTTFTLLEALQPFFETAPEKVAEAIQLFAERPSTPLAKIVAHVKGSAVAGAAPTGHVVQVKMGRKDYAEVSLKGSRLVVTLKAPAKGAEEAILSDIAKLLRDRAEAK